MTMHSIAGFADRDIELLFNGNLVISIKVSISYGQKLKCLFIFFFSCSSVDVMEEAKKLIGTGNRHLVMGDVVSAVSVFQEACAML